MRKLNKWKLLVPLALLVVIVVISASGCSSAIKASNFDQTQSNQAQAQDQNNKTLPNNKSASINPNGYYTGMLDKKLFQVTRSNNRITAIHSMGYNLNITIDYDKNHEHYISSIIFNDSPIKEIDFKGDFDAKPNNIGNLGLSSDKKLLTIELDYIEGAKVLVVNLNTGEKFILNDILEKLTGKYVEVLRPYSWAPKGEKIAFSYGPIGTSKLAIYDFETKLLSPIPANGNLIGTEEILWSNNGNQFDFISEYPSDNFYLYRYFLTDNKVIRIKKVPSNEILTKYPDPNINLVSKVPHP